MVLFGYLWKGVKTVLINCVGGHMEFQMFVMSHTSGTCQEKQKYNWDILSNHNNFVWNIFAEDLAT